MHSDYRETALKAKAWPFEEARALLKRFEKSPPKKEYALFQTGYGPSGLPHIGTFGEVARTTMIQRAFEIISGMPTKLICFSDDMDGMRKIPESEKNPARLEPYLQRPLIEVPGPEGSGESFAGFNNAKLREFLDSFGFEYEFISATDFYRSGRMDAILIRALERYEDIMEVMLASLREERRATYSCFLPISPKTGRVLYVPIRNPDPDNGTITFDDEDGEETTISVKGGQVKFQWKPDFAARWAALDVDFEMYGKDHATNTPIYDRICKILGGRPPAHFTYELFLDDKGQKISKTKGNGITIEEWLSYASPESLSYFMYQKPKTAKRLYFDVIPKAVDEYHQQLRSYPDQDATKQFANPVFHIHAGRDVPASSMSISFSMLLNLASVSGAQEKETLWGFIRRYAPETSPETHPDLDQAAEHAIRYYHDFILETKQFREPDARDQAALEELRAKLEDYKGEVDSELLQSLVFEVGKAHEYDPLRSWFQTLYEVLLGASQGPRFGSFIALYGVEETIRLIRDGLTGKLSRDH